MLTNVQDLGTTANNAVFTPAANFEREEQSDEDGDEINDDDDSDDNANDVVQTEVENKATVDELLQKISLWRRPDSALL